MDQKGIIKDGVKFDAEGKLAHTLISTLIV